MIQRIPRALIVEAPVVNGYYVVTDVPGATGWYLSTGTSYSSTHRMDYKNDASGYYLFWSNEYYYVSWWFSSALGVIEWSCTSYLETTNDYPPLGDWNYWQGSCRVSLN